MRDDSNNPNISASVKPMITVYTSAGKLVNTLRVSAIPDQLSWLSAGLLI